MFNCIKITFRRRLVMRLERKPPYLIERFHISEFLNICCYSVVVFVLIDSSFVQLMTRTYQGDGVFGTFDVVLAIHFKSHIAALCGGLAKACSNCNQTFAFLVTVHPSSLFDSASCDSLTEPLSSQGQYVWSTGVNRGNELFVNDEVEIAKVVISAFF